MMRSIHSAVGATSYPGRGILMGKSPDGKQAVFAYFIMGRSANSRNRVFVQDLDGIRTQAFDPSQMQDPTLIIYAPVRKFGNHVIVTNGDQTDTVCEFLRRGGSFEEALKTRTFEPDAPNFTPRISAMATFAQGDFSLQMRVLKAADAEGSAALRCFYDFDCVPAGQAYFIHTYRSDGNPIPSFEGEPEKVSLASDDLDEIAGEIWAALDRDNRVSLWVECTNLATGESDRRILNKNN